MPDAGPDDATNVMSKPLFDPRLRPQQSRPARPLGETAPASQRGAPERAPLRGAVPGAGAGLPARTGSLGAPRTGFGASSAAAPASIARPNPNSGRVARPPEPSVPDIDELIARALPERPRTEPPPRSTRPPSARPRFEPPSPESLRSGAGERPVYDLPGPDSYGRLPSQLPRYEAKPDFEGAFPEEDAEDIIDRTKAMSRADLTPSGTGAEYFPHQTPSRPQVSQRPPAAQQGEYYPPPVAPAAAYPSAYPAPPPGAPRHPDPRSIYPQQAYTPTPSPEYQGRPDAYGQVPAHPSHPLHPMHLHAAHPHAHALSVHPGMAADAARSGMSEPRALPYPGVQLAPLKAASLAPPGVPTLAAPAGVLGLVFFAAPLALATAIVAALAFAL